VSDAGECGQTVAKGALNRGGDSIVLLAINVHAANLHYNYGYSIIYISLSITLTSASPLPPPIKRGIKAYSMSAVT
jgi:hypothetical protein